MRQITHGVLNIIIISALFYLATNRFYPEYDSIGGYYLLDTSFTIKYFSMWPIGTENFKPWQIVTHMFMHDFRGMGHLFFNMFALYMFGTALERVWGTKKFIFFYLSCGVGAVLIYSLVYSLLGQGSVLSGASGAVFGLLAAFAYKFPDVRLMLLFPPIPIKAKYFVLGYAAIEMFLLFSNQPEDSVAHLAHLAGALVGYLLVKYWEKKGNDYRMYN